MWPLFGLCIFQEHFLLIFRSFISTPFPRQLHRGFSRSWQPANFAANFPNHCYLLSVLRKFHFYGLLMLFLYFGDQQVLRPFLLRRLKKEVESQLPEKVRKPLLQYMSFNLDQSLSQGELRDQIYIKLISLDVIKHQKKLFC